MLTANRDLMATARERLRGRWGISVGVAFIYVVIMALLGSIPYAGSIAVLVVTGPLLLGYNLFILSLARGQETRIGQLFDGFSSFGNAFLTYLLICVFILLWSLLLIIPGIVASFAYAVTFFIMVDDRNVAGTDAIKKSKAMMQGHKWKLCCLMGRFFGWFLLCLLTIGIGFLWLMPYLATSVANFYDDVRRIDESRQTPAQAAPVSP